MIRISILRIVVGLMYACLLGSSYDANAQELVGKGDWQSLKAEAVGGTWTVELTRAGADLRGSIQLTGSTLFSGGTVSGTVDGQQVVLGVMAEGVKQASFSGKLTGESVSGEWECPAIKDEGMWSGTLNSPLRKGRFRSRGSSCGERNEQRSIPRRGCPCTFGDPYPAPERQNA